MKDVKIFFTLSVIEKSMRDRLSAIELLNKGEDDRKFYRALIDYWMFLIRHYEEGMLGHCLIMYNICGCLRFEKINKNQTLVDIACEAGTLEDMIYKPNDEYFKCLEELITQIKDLDKDPQYKTKAEIILDKAYEETDTYLKQENYKNFSSMEQFDSLVLKIIKEWIEGKINDYTFSEFFEIFEGDPLHHHSKYLDPFYWAIDINYYLLIEENPDEAEKLKEKIRDWYRKISKK